ncbi:MAG: siderophore biosynthesis protein [Methylobacter sp.]|nr:MAG: siderophore biosynthesis protein [Methylobacter sp.]
MNSIAVQTLFQQFEEADYLCRRVLDALLREDVQNLVSHSHWFCAESVPFRRQLPGKLKKCQWLAARHLSGGCLWLAVKPGSFMQSWVLHDLPVCWESAGRYQWLDDLENILGLFYQALNGEARQRFEAFAEECKVAVEHSIICRQEKQRYFNACQMQSSTGSAPIWLQHLLHYERLAAFLDHPFYPTARAKLGFDADDLAAYSPEFQNAFRLNWLAVPKALCRRHGNIATTGILPDFSDLGLDPSHADSHELLPVHPFMWGERLHTLLRDHGLLNRVLLAPKTALEVVPTLSVRTVQLCNQPRVHLKLPLAIRTLGGMNIRTIKPSTIEDGHTVQTLLGKIIQDEPKLRGLVLLTDESRGLTAAESASFGYIVRQYPNAIEHGTTVAVAGLLAETPKRNLVVEQLVEFYFDDDKDFLEAYLDITLRLHLTLWLRYGIALESNQQNSLLVVQQEEPRLRLLLKDNDAPRIYPAMLATSRPDLAEALERLVDRRILAENELALAQMFTTITLQLNITSLLEGLAATGKRRRDTFYRQLHAKITEVLDDLEGEGVNTRSARDYLLESEWHYLKLLLTAATLQGKHNTGAADVNKYYGKTAPNRLRQL